MPYKTTWDNHGICWQLEGIITSQEIFDLTNDFYQNPKSDRIKYQIVDCTHVEQFALDDTISTMAEIAALDYAASLSIHNVKVALVATRPKIKRINQEYIDNSRLLHSNWEIKIFDDLLSARNWVSGIS